MDIARIIVKFMFTIMVRFIARILVKFIVRRHCSAGDDQLDNILGEDEEYVQCGNIKTGNTYISTRSTRMPQLSVASSNAFY